MTEIGILGEREERRKKSAENRRRFEEIVKELEAEVAAETAREKLEARLKPRAAEPAEEAKPSIVHGSAYAVTRTVLTYASGAHALRRTCEKDPYCVHPTFTRSDGSVVYRPLTFEENIRARLDDYNTLNNPDGSKRTEKNRKRLFNTWLGSCTGIAYKEGSTLFKIITRSEDLIDIPQKFSDYYIQANYSQLQGAELDSSKGKYNESLTKRQVLKHPAWNAAVADRQLLKDYAELIFGLVSGNHMGFSVRQNTSNDELRALFVYNIYVITYYSDAIGKFDLNFLNSNCRFVRVTHVAPKAP